VIKEKLTPIIWLLLLTTAGFMSSVQEDYLRDVPINYSKSMVRAGIMAVSMGLGYLLWKYVPSTRFSQKD
jgi:hypothetical protein